jgi:hypothetical protein
MKFGGFNNTKCKERLKVLSFEGGRFAFPAIWIVSISGRHYFGTSDWLLKS